MQKITANRRRIRVCVRSPPRCQLGFAFVFPLTKAVEDVTGPYHPLPPVPQGGISNLWRRRNFIIISKITNSIVLK
jgi:hypothetical protein